MDHFDNQMFDPAPADDIYSMDNVELFGKVESNHSYREMVSRGHVVDTKIHLIESDCDLWDQMGSDDDVHLVVDGETIILTTDNQKAKAAAMIAVNQWLQVNLANGNAKKILPFMSTISDCERAVDPNHPLSLVKGIDGIHTEVFHSGLSPKQRMMAKDRFAKDEGPAIMPSVKAIREGVSIDSVDTVVLLRGYGSDDDGMSGELQQHHGRGVRLGLGKTHCNVVIPIPPVGKADATRRNILRMVTELMEELGILSEVINVIENGDTVTAGRLAAGNVFINGSTTVTEQDIVDSIKFNVLEYIEEYDAVLHNKLKIDEVDSYLDKFKFA